MLRLAARSSPRGAPFAQWCRAASTTAPTPGPSKSSGTSNPAPEKQEIIGQLERLAKGNQKPSNAATSTSKPNQTSKSNKATLTENPTTPQALYRQLGLKHNPEELPYKRELDPNDTSITEEQFAATLVHGRAVHEPYYHPRTHSIPVANLHFRSHHIRLLNLFTHVAAHAASSLGIPVSKTASLPTKRRLWTVLRSPFVHKKSQENFERKTHKRAIKAWDADPEVVHRWITYLRANAMPGVGLKVTTWERLPLDVSASTMAQADLLTGMQNNFVDAPQKIKALGKKIEVEESSLAGEKA